MRRLAATTLLVSVLVSVASPAFAQRDPFEPAIDEGVAESPEGEAPVQEPAAEQPQPEPLADTGLEGRPWAALAYVLVAVGAGLVLVTRVARAGPE